MKDVLGVFFLSVSNIFLILSNNARGFSFVFEWFDDFSRRNIEEKKQQNIHNTLVY